MADRDKVPSRFLDRFTPIGTINPKDHEDLKRIQLRLEAKNEHIYLWGREILQKNLGDPLTLYSKKL